MQLKITVLKVAVNKNKVIDHKLIPFLDALAELIVDSYERGKEREHEKRKQLLGAQS